MIAGSTAYVEAFSAAMQARFFSESFSRFGERFVYVQAEASYVPREERVEHRSRLQHAVDEALASRKLGAVIGGSSGVQWDYIDLAVTDLPRAAEVIAEALRSASVPRPSWIRCHDATLSAEWRGIWDDVEPPPSFAAEAEGQEG